MRTALGEGGMGTVFEAVHVAIGRSVAVKVLHPRQARKKDAVRRFHQEARARYDAALCMYHDQALIPIKTIDFHGGVNVTLGLPFVRTSPDHGTAFAIAGRGVARAESMIAALRLAADMAARRAVAG